MVGTGRDNWRTDTKGLEGGPQGSNLFPQPEGLLPRGVWIQIMPREPAPSAGANGPLPVCFRLLNPFFSLFENI